MPRSVKLVTALIATVFSLLVSPAIAANKLKVVATFSIIGDFARNIGGDRIALTTLVGPNGDAHVYELKPADAGAVAAASVVLVNGLQFEGFLQRLVDTNVKKANIIEVARGANVLREEGHSHGAYDPHAWHSIPNVLVYVKNIADAFCNADPSGCPSYRANAVAYSDKLKVLDQEIRSSISRIPENRRTIITSHDAFGYLAHEYGLKFLAPQGLSTEAEASAADVAALIRQVKRDKASGIFVDNIGDKRLAEQIARETGLRLGGALYSDALSDQQGPASTYIAMMRYNVMTIQQGVLGRPASAGKETAK